MAKIRSVSRLEYRARGLAELTAGCKLRHQPSGIFGRPDYANKKRRVAVFVDGCLWHCCPVHFKMPKTNVEFWAKKLARNVERRHEVVCRLMSEGWDVITIWEHEVKAHARRSKVGPPSGDGRGGRDASRVPPPTVRIEGGKGLGSSPAETVDG